MATGSAILGLSRKGSDLEQLITEHACGINVIDSNPVAIAESILMLINDKELLKKCKLNSYQAFLDNYTDELITNRYYQALLEIG